MGIIRTSERLIDLVEQSGHSDLALILNRGFVAVRALHIHFYENDMPANAVKVAFDDVGAALDLMQQIYAAEPTQSEMPQSEMPE